MRKGEYKLEPREGQREREKVSQEDSTLSDEPDMGLDFMTLRSWPELKPRVRGSTTSASNSLLFF